MRDVIPNDEIVLRRKKIDEQLDKIFKIKEVDLDAEPVEEISMAKAKSIVRRFYGYFGYLYYFYGVEDRLAPLFTKKQHETPTGTRRTIPLVIDEIAKMPLFYDSMHKDLIESRQWNYAIKDWKQYFVGGNGAKVKIDWSPAVFDELGTLDCDAGSCFGPDYERWADPIKLACGINYKVPTFVLHGMRGKNIISRCWGMVMKIRPLTLWITNHYGEEDPFYDTGSYKTFLEKMVEKELIVARGIPITVPVYKNTDGLVLWSTKQPREWRSPLVGAKCVRCRTQHKYMNEILCFHCMPDNKEMECEICHEECDNKQELVFIKNRNKYGCCYCQDND